MLFAPEAHDPRFLAREQVLGRHTVRSAKELIQESLALFIVWNVVQMHADQRKLIALE